MTNLNALLQQLEELAASAQTYAACDVLSKIDEHLSSLNEEDAKAATTDAQKFLMEMVRSQSKEFREVAETMLNDDGWNLCAETKQGIKTFLRADPNSDITLVTMKGRCEINAPPQNIIALMNETDQYGKWVPLVKDADTLREVSTFCNIYTVRFDFPMPISFVMSNRDLVFEGFVGDMLDSKELQAIVVVVRDLHDVDKERFKRECDFDAPPPPKKYIRVSLRNGGMVLKPISATKTMVDCMLDIDPAISLPSAIVSLLTKKFSVMFFELLKKRCENLEKVYLQRIKEKKMYTTVADRVNEKFPSA